MKKLFFTAVLILVFLRPAIPQDSEKPVSFKGGMMLHSGFLKNSRENEKIRGSCFGIGGKLSFAVSKHFRLGTEGYASTLDYADQDGYYKLGWGGLLVDYQIYEKRRLNPVISLTLGGGRVKDAYFLESVPDLPATHEVIFRSYATFLATPSISLEYSLKTKLTLVLKADYAIPLMMKQNGNFAYGPRFYLGVLFNRH